MKGKKNAIWKFISITTAYQSHLASNQPVSNQIKKLKTKQNVNFVTKKLLKIIMKTILETQSFIEKPIGADKMWN